MAQRMVKYYAVSSINTYIMEKHTVEDGIWPQAGMCNSYILRIE